MSTEIDWSKAPEGATHFDPDSSDMCWEKHVGGSTYAWSNTNSKWYGYRCTDEHRLIARVLPEWSGEGLPPIGTVCEWRDDEAASWQKVEVRYLSKHTALLHFPGDGDGDTEGAFSPSCCQFRPLRTPEQIAAEERLDRVHAIEGIMLRGQELALTVTQIAAAIDDAGYRKVEGGEK